MTPKLAEVILHHARRVGFDPDAVRELEVVLEEAVDATANELARLGRRLDALEVRADAVERPDPDKWAQS